MADSFLHLFNLPAVLSVFSQSSSNCESWNKKNGGFSNYYIFMAKRIEFATNMIQMKRVNVHIVVNLWSMKIFSGYDYFRQSNYLSLFLSNLSYRIFSLWWVVYPSPFTQIYTIDWAAGAPWQNLNNAIGKILQPEIKHKSLWCFFWVHVWCILVMSQMWRHFDGISLGLHNFTFPSPSPSLW